jgi:hypothetical protein
MKQTGEALHLLGDLITFTITRADARTANLAIERVGERLEALARGDLARRPAWGEVFADEVAYHAARIARACLEAEDAENFAALVGLAERVTVALLETGHGPAAYPLLRHLMQLGREVVRRGEAGAVASVLDAIARAGRTYSADGAGDQEPSAHLLDAAASALGAVGRAAAGARFEARSLGGDDGAAVDPTRVALERIEALGGLAVDIGLDAAARAALAAAADVGRAAAEAEATAAVPVACGALRRMAARAASRGRGAPVAEALDALTDLAEAGRHLERVAVVEAALRGLAALGPALEGGRVALPGGEDAEAACAAGLRAAGEGYEYLLARALRDVEDGPFRRRFHTTPVG